MCQIKESIFEINTMLILYISDIKRVGLKNKLNQNLLVDIQARDKRTGAGGERGDILVNWLH